MKCRQNSGSLRVRAGSELRSSNKFGASLVDQTGHPNGQVWFPWSVLVQFGSSLITIVNCEYPYCPLALPYLEADQIEEALVWE